MNTLKICTRCGIEKEVSLFYPSKKTKDGVRCQCIKCGIAYNKYNSKEISKIKKEYQRTLNGLIMQIYSV